MPARSAAGTGTRGTPHRVGAPHSGVPTTSRERKMFVRLIVVNSQGRASVMPTERRLRAMADGSLGVVLNDEVRAVRLVSLPLQNYPFALVDHRLPPKAEARDWPRDATERDFDAEVAKGVPIAPVHVLKDLAPLIREWLATKTRP